MAPVFRDQLPVTMQAIDVESTGLDSGANRAPGLPAMSAIAESAITAQVFYLGKHVSEPAIGVHKLELAHSWRINEPTTGRQPVHGPPGSSVTAALIVLPYATGGQDGFAQRIDQRRLPTPG